MHGSAEKRMRVAHNCGDWRLGIRRMSSRWIPEQSFQAAGWAFDENISMN
jgi:hypothetical protein